MATAITYNELQALYLGLFDRPADAGGETYWESNSTSASSTAQSLGGFAQYYSDDKGGAGVAGAAISSSNITGEITNLYTNMLGYTPAAGDAGVAYWAGVFNSDITTMTAGAAIGSIANQIFNIIESLPANSPYINDQKFLNNAIATASSYTAANANVTYNNAAYLTEGQAIFATPTMTTTNLTTAIDNIAPVGNTNIYGTLGTNSSAAGTGTDTLNPLDTIKATGSNNNLYISDQGNSSNKGQFDFSSVNVSGVQTANIQSTVGESSLNVSGWTGLTALNLTASNGKDVITAAGTTNVTIKDTITTNTKSVSVTGGNNVTVTNSSNVTIGSSSTAKNNPTGAVTVNNSSTAGTVNVYGGTTVNITETNTAAIIVGASGSVLAPSGLVTVNDTGGTGAINIYGGASSSVTIDSAIGNAVTIAGVTGANTVNDTNYYTTNASNYNNININGGTNATVVTDGGGTNTSATNNTVVIGSATAPTGTVSVTDSNSGPNGDYIYVDNNSKADTVGAINVNDSYSTGGTITIGTATPSEGVSGNVTVNDSSNISGTVYYGASVIDVYTDGATSVSITGGGNGGAITDEGSTNKLTTISLTGMQGTQTITDTALTSLTISDSGVANPNTNSSSGNYTATTAALGSSVTTLGLTLSNDVSETVTTSTAKTLNITATGSTADTLTLTDTASAKIAATFTNNGTGALTVSGDLSNTGAAGNTIQVAGSGAVNLGTQDTSTKLASITAVSGQSGNISATISANYGTTGVNFTGGSGANTVTLDAGTTPANGVRGVINGGTGSDNTLIYTAVATDFAFNTPLTGGLVENFQNLVLSTSAVSGNYYSGGYKTLAVNSLGNAQSTANAVTFTSVAADTPLTFIGGSTTTNTATAAQLTVTYSAGNPLSTVIDGVTVSITQAAGTATSSATALALQINEENILGVSATSAAGVVTVTGADSVTAGTNDTVTTALATTGGLTESYVSSAQSSTGNAQTITIGSSGATANVTGYLHEANNQTITVNSVAGTSSANTNTLTIADTTTAAQANSADKIVITGAGNLTLSYLDEGTGASKVATIDASASSGNVDITHVQGISTGITIDGGSGMLTAWGSGIGSGEIYSAERGANDVITAGSGGIDYTIGYGGAGAASGSEKINLSASTVSDTLNVGSSAVDGDHATISGFKAIGSANSDVITYINANPTALASATYANQTVLTDVPSSNPGSAGNDTYTATNGVITFTGTDSGAALITDAETIANAAGANHIAAFNVGSTTYVVDSGAGATTLTDSVLTITGTNAGSVTGFANVAASGNGSTAAAGIIEVGTSSTTLTQNAVTDAGTGTTTTAGNGDASASITSATGGTHTFTGLAASAVINDATVASDTLTALDVTQVGTQGQDSLTLNQTTAHTITALNVSGDWAMTIYDTAANTITTLADSNSINTLTTLTLNGNSALDLKAITDTALTTVNINDSGAVTLGDGTALSQSGLTVNIGSGASVSTTVDLSGANDTVIAKDANTGTITDSGNGLTFIDKGANHAVTVDASGTGNNITIAAANTSVNSITVGANSTVTLGTTDNGPSTINVSGDVTGATSSGSYTLTKVINADQGHTVIEFASAGTTSALSSAVNVASATSLANALDIAAANESATNTLGTLYVDWFQFGGNTYLVEHTGTGAAETGLGAKDIVVELVGMHTTSISGSAGHITV